MGFCLGKTPEKLDPALLKLLFLQAVGLHLLVQDLPHVLVHRIAMVNGAIEVADAESGQQGCSACRLSLLAVLSWLQTPSWLSKLTLRSKPVMGIGRSVLLSPLIYAGAFLTCSVELCLAAGAGLGSV